MKIDVIQNGNNDVGVYDAYANGASKLETLNYFRMSDVNKATRVLVANGADDPAPAILKFGPEGNTGSHGHSGAATPKNIIGSFRIPKYGYVIIDKKPDERLCAGFYANGQWSNQGEGKKISIIMLPVAK
jgi:hypothetical protein